MNRHEYKLCIKDSALIEGNGIKMYAEIDYISFVINTDRRKSYFMGVIKEDDGVFTVWTNSMDLDDLEWRFVSPIPERWVEELRKESLQSHADRMEQAIAEFLEDDRMRTASELRDAILAYREYKKKQS